MEVNVIEDMPAKAGIHRRLRAARVLILLVALVLALSAVMAGRAGTPAARNPATTKPGSSSANTVTLPERQGAGSGATLWALFFTDPSDLHPGEEIKIAW